MRLLCVALIAAALLSPSAAAAQERRFFAGAFVLENTIGESAALELLLPQALRATAAGALVLYDAGDAQVRAFSPGGVPLWTFGRKGRGPGEFHAVEDVLVDHNSDILVLDNENRRVTRLRADGTMKELVPLPAAAVARRLLPTLGGADVTYVPMGSMLWESARAAARVGRAPLPSPIRYPANIAAEQFTTGHAHGAVIVFRWSSRIIFLDTIGMVLRVTNGIEAITFPDAATSAVDIPDVGRATVTRVRPGAPEAARSVSVRAGRVYVLFAGGSADAGRIVDVYELGRGAYLGSYRLPAVARELALLPDGRFATLEAEPVPVVRIWRFAPN